MQRVQDAKGRADRLETGWEQRQAAGLTTPEEDWWNTRSILMVLKITATRPIKSVKADKSVWGEQRRKITPKIGQLTSDPRAIREITDFIYDQVIMPPQRLPPMLYTALLSSLAKSFLMQAEIEVTAVKKAAIPLAQVAFTLLDRLETFPDIFFAKLLQRCGGWSIPCAVPDVDFDGRPWKDDAERIKVMGYRRSAQRELDAPWVMECTVEYMNRVAGPMRLYFHILRIPPQTRPMPPMFQLPRFWMWFARILNNHSLLESPVAAQLIYVGLDVLGSHALEVWGHQWVKMLELIYAGVTDGFAEGRFIGGSTGAGISVRARVQI
ncbi:GLE1-like protein-domain-containing protein [Mycena polygramma]|nr:GLE1-like protein-domain-containing protein [Mycena polygramma]